MLQPRIRLKSMDADISRGIDFDLWNYMSQNIVVSSSKYYKEDGLIG
jgi:hypothetical protein